MGLAIIYLYDSTEKEFDYNGQPLPEAYDVVVDYEINDSYFVTFKHPLDKDEVYKQIKKDMIVTVHTPDGMQPMRIMDNSKGMDEVEFEAWPLFYADMRTKLVRPLSLNNAAGHTAVTQFVNHLVSDTPFKFTTNISDRHDYHTQSQEDAESSPNELFDALEVFKDLVARWNGEVIIDGYDVRVVDRIGEDKDALLYEKKNIASFLDKESIQGVVTRLYGEAQWTEEVEDGDSVDHSISTVVDSPLIDAYSGVVFEKQYTNNNIRTEEDLKRWLNLKFSTENIDKPSRNLEVDTNIIGGKEINTGDGLVLKYLKHDVDAQMRMIGYEYNGFNDKYITIYIGDASESFTGNVQNNIRDFENNVSNKIDRKTDVILNDLGEKIIFSDSEPKGNFKNGDTWFDSAGNIWMWNEDRARWETHPTKDVVDQALKEAQKDIESAREQADLAVEKINTDIADKFTSLDEEILSIEAISNNAQSNASDALDGVENALSDASVAIDRSLTAINDASSAINRVSSLEGTVIDIEEDFTLKIDEITGELEYKAEKSVVDTLSGIVDDHTLDIKANTEEISSKASQSSVDTLTGTMSDHTTQISQNATDIRSKADSSTVDTLSGTVDKQSTLINQNAEGLELKANKDTVDTLEGTVSSLGAEFDVVAGKVSSKVWMSDIDDLSYENRNYALGTSNTPKAAKVGNYSGSLIDNNVATKFTYTLEELGVKAGDTLTASIYVGESEEGYGGSLRIDDQRGSNVYSDYTVAKNGYATETFVIEEETTELRFYLGARPTGNYVIHVKEFKVEKGSVRTPWSPAPEDTDAKFEYIESEFTQTFESFEQVVSSIDGRVTSQDQRIDSVTTTIQEVQSDIDGNTKLINQTKSTVDTHTQTIATIESDLDGKVEITKYNTLVSTVESTIQRIGDAEGNITQIEANIDGLQSTVADKASQTEVTQLAIGFNVLATDFENMEIGGRNYVVNSTTDWATVTVGEWGYSGMLKVPIDGVFLKQGDTITFSVYVSDIPEGEAVSARVDWYRDDLTYQNAGSGEYITSNGRIVFTATIPDDSSFTEVRGRISPQSWNGSYKVDYRHEQLEKSTTATDWSPAPEDMATQAQLSVLNDNINLRVTSSQLDSAISDSLSTAQEYADSTAQTAKKAAQKYAETKAAAERELAEIYAGGLVSSEQKERIAAIKNNLSEAQKYAETKADEAKTAADNYTDTVADEKVDIGQVVSQINIETDNILIQSGKLLLDADTVAFSGNAFIPGAYIKDASIDTAQIADLAVSSGKIANLDVNKLSGNRSEFVQSHWNSVAGGNVRINGTGILTTADDGSQTYIQNGIVGTRQPNGHSIGRIGYVPDGTGSPVYRIRTTWGAHFAISNTFYDDYVGSTRTKDTMKVSVYDYDGNPAYTDVTWRANAFRLYGGSFRLGDKHYISGASADRLSLTGRESIGLRARESTVFAVSRNSGGRNSASLYANLNMNGSNVTNQSDRRMKEHINDISINSLETIKGWNFVDFEWIDPNKPQGTQIGLIAQDTKEISMYDDDTETWLTNNSKQLMMTTHAVQQLANQHENTLELASAAYLRTETHEQKIKRLEERIKELEGKDA